MNISRIIYTIFNTIPLSGRGTINMTLFSVCNIKLFEGSSGFRIG